MEQDLYSKLGKELRTLFNDLKVFDKGKRRAIRVHMDHILEIAFQIGGKVQAEAERLDDDIARFMDDPDNPTHATVLRKHALRLEQETRDL